MPDPKPETCVTCEGAGFIYGPTVNGVGDGISDVHSNKQECPACKGSCRPAESGNEEAVPLRDENLRGAVGDEAPACGFGPNGSVTLCMGIGCKFCDAYILASEIFHTVRHLSQSGDAIAFIMQELAKQESMIVERLTLILRYCVAKECGCEKRFDEAVEKLY